MTTRSPLRRAALLGMAATAAAGAAALAAAPATRVAAAAPDHVLSQEAVSEIGVARLVGPVAPQTAMSVGVTLQAPDPAGEQAAIAAIYDKASPDYHHFLTPATFAARFGVAQSTYDAVVQRYTALGMRVVYAATARDFVELQATAAQAEAAFHVDLRQYRTADGHVFFANAQAPTVPADVVAVSGLSDLGALLVRSHQGDCVQGVCTGALEASELWQIYDMPAAVRGAGQKIAIIGSGDIDTVVPNLRQYEAERSLPQVPVVKHLVGANPGTDDSNQSEWDLDSEASTAMAPDAAELDYYFTATLGDPAAFQAWADDPSGPSQANASFGGCESLNVELGDAMPDDAAFAQAVGEGRTQFVSTGDTGGSCTVLTGNGIVNTGVPQVEWPAASRYVIAVGGTVLYSDGSGHRATTPAGPGEFAWTHTGGGSSISQPEPAWQQQISAVNGVCTVDEDGKPNTAAAPCRGLPDVAALSGDITVNAGGDGIKDVELGSDSVDGGTSLSSPLWCGMWARMQSAAGGTLGFAAPALYALALDPTTDARDFYDVSVGTNGQYRAVARSSSDPTGWDYVSGLGVPDVGAMIADLTGQPAVSVPEAPSGAWLLIVAPCVIGAGAAWRRRRAAVAVA